MQEKETIGHAGDRKQGKCSPYSYYSDNHYQGVNHKAPTKMTGGHEKKTGLDKLDEACHKVRTWWDKHMVYHARK